MQLPPRLVLGRFNEYYALPVHVAGHQRLQIDGDDLEVRAALPDHQSGPAGLDVHAEEVANRFNRRIDQVGQDQECDVQHVIPLVLRHFPGLPYRVLHLALHIVLQH